MKVLLTCNACGLVDSPIDVPARGATEKIEEWFEGVLRVAVWQAHRRRSPHCRAEAATYIKVPLSEGKRLGDT